MAIGRILSIYFDPPMAIARVGTAKEPVDAYTWAMDQSPHRGLQTHIVPAPTLVPVRVQVTPAKGKPYEAFRLEVRRPNQVRFKDNQGRIRKVAPFFSVWARVLDGQTGEVSNIPVTDRFLKSLGGTRRDIEFTVNAGNRKAQARTKEATGAVLARIQFPGDDYKPHPLMGVSPHGEGEEPLAMPSKPLKLGVIQTFVGVEDKDEPEARLDQVRLRFTPGTGNSFGPPEATIAPASPLPPGDFEPVTSELGRLHTVVAEENRILNSKNSWLGYSYSGDSSAKWPSPMDSYDGARVGLNKGWGVIDDTCDLTIEVSLTAQGQVFTGKARAFVGPPDFAPDRRPFYSIRDDLDDRDLPPFELDPETTPEVILDLFRRIFETTTTLNLDQRRSWALPGNAGLFGAPDPDKVDWDDGVMPHIGPRSMRAEDAPYAELTPDYTPHQPAAVAPLSGATGRLPYTMVLQQVHARMASSPILQEFLARRPGRVKRLVRPPFAPLKDLPRRVGMTPTAEVEMKQPDDGLGPVRYRDPRNLNDLTYDMRMPPFMRHNMGYPLSISRRHYLLLMAYLDKLETDPEWRARALTPAKALDGERSHD